MKAFRRFARQERAARLVELPVPEPAENQVLLRVSHCGICGSDLHAWLNHKGYESVLPEVTFGHELSGTVEKLGDKAKVWNVGDNAIMIALQTPHDPNDRYCRESLPLKLAALTEPLSVAEHCIGNRSAIGEGSNVVVSGPGIIGLLCAISARSRGANVLLSGTERDEPTRLRAAREIGFETLVVGPGLVSLNEQILHSFPEGADALVEASGSNLALSESWKSVRPNGIVTAVALYSRAIELDVTQFLRKQIDLRTSYASSKDDYLKAFGLLQAGAVDLDVLTREYPLSSAEKGFLDSEALKVTKVLLNCS